MNPNIITRIDTGPGRILNTSSSLIAYTATLYDAAGRISRRVNADRDATGVLEFTYNYDIAGRVLNETENGALTTYTHDNSDQILTETRFGHAAAYDYTLGNRASVDSTNNAEDRSYTLGVDNRYDSDGLWDYAYSDEGNLIGKSTTSTVDSTAWTYRYNHRNQMTLAERRIDGVHADLRTEYRYDPFGNRVARIVDSDGDGYVGITEQLPASATASSEWVGYEASNVSTLGNWNAWIPSNEVAGETIIATYEHAAAATAVTVYQLTDYNWVTRIEVYDLDESDWVIVWDDQTPLAVAGTVSFPAILTDKVRVTVDASASSTFEAPVIDAIKLHGTASRPKTQAEGGDAAAVTTLFTLDMWNPAKSVGIGLENTDVYADHVDGSLTSRYLRGDQVDELLGRFDLTTYGGQTIGRKWTLTDNQGSIRAVLSGTASILARTDYDAFGNRKSLTGSSSNPEAELGRYQWTGREREAEIDQYFNRARYYDPQMGRWTSKDPIGFDAGDSNLYRYVRNGPTIYGDPSGFLPGSHRGTWVQGEAGNGVFEFGDTALNRERGVVGMRVRFENRGIPSGGFPAGRYWNGDPAASRVDIGTIDGTRGDIDRTDAEFRRTRGVEVPDGYTWHHVGSPGSTVLELVESTAHSTTSHSGPAAPFRAQTRAAARIQAAKASGLRVVSALDCYSTLRDVCQMAGIGYPDVSVEYEAEYFIDDEGAVYRVAEYDWPRSLISGPFKEYVGPDEGKTSPLSASEYSIHKRAVEEKYGKVIEGGWFKETIFVPGYARKTLPAYDEEFGTGRKTYHLGNNEHHAVIAA